VTLGPVTVPSPRRARRRAATRVDLFIPVTGKAAGDRKMNRCFTGRNPGGPVTGTPGVPQLPEAGPENSCLRRPKPVVVKRAGRRRRCGTSTRSRRESATSRSRPRLPEPGSRGPKGPGGNRMGKRACVAAKTVATGESHDRRSPLPQTGNLVDVVAASRNDGMRLRV